VEITRSALHVALLMSATGTMSAIVGTRTGSPESRLPTTSVVRTMRSLRAPSARNRWVVDWIVVPHRQNEQAARQAATAAGPRHGTRDEGGRVMLMPPVSRYMSAPPVTIDRKASLARAHLVMREYGIRHLPVVDGGELCGIVSERDLYFFEHAAHLLPTTPVEDVMTDRPFVVTGDSPLDEVVAIMGEKKYGSVVVAGKHGVEGVFTAVDACRALSEILQREVA
jgi:acetoin utilization protein AcuB